MVVPLFPVTDWLAAFTVAIEHKCVFPVAHVASAYVARPTLLQSPGRRAVNAV